MRFVAYYWLSTRGRDDKLADLDAQRAAADAFARSNGGEVIAEYLEIEWAHLFTWPKLSEAIANANGVQATLVVAKLDRLVRNMAFTTRLNESEIDFACCDNPTANRQTIHILAALAAEETKRISTRTREALRAAKERGVKLGSACTGHWEGREDRRREGARRGLPIAVMAAAAARRRQAEEAYGELLPRIIKLRYQDRLTLAEIARQISAEGHRTQVGLPFTATMIFRLLKRAAVAKSEPQAPLPEPPADFSDMPLFRPSHEMAGVGES
jgi:DNA invertase Pin-like site-specific DNA recombinase